MHARIAALPRAPRSPRSPLAPWTRVAAERPADYRARGLWNDATLWRRAVQHANERPDALAVADRDGERTHSFRAVVEAARAFAGHLQAHGVEAGSVVSIQLPNQLEAVVAALAAQAPGAVVHPVLPGYPPRGLEHVFRGAKPRARVTAASTTPRSSTPCARRPASRRGT